MSLAPSAAVPRATFNPLPLYIGLFCLLWSFAFVAGTQQRGFIALCAATRLEGEVGRQGRALSGAIGQ